MTESIADIAVQHQKNRGTFHHNRMYIIAAAASASQKKSQRFSTNTSFLLMIFTTRAAITFYQPSITQLSGAACNYAPRYEDFLCMLLNSNVQY